MAPAACKPVAMPPVQSRYLTTAMSTRGRATMADIATDDKATEVEVAVGKGRLSQSAEDCRLVVRPEGGL